MPFLLRAVSLSLILMSSLAAQSDWTWRNPLPQGNDLWAVRATGTGFAAFGTTGTVLVSDNGTDWTMYEDALPGCTGDVVWTGSLLVALGDSGCVRTSADGREWNVLQTGTVEALYAGAWGDSMLVAVGPRGKVAVSADGITWNMHDLPDSATALNGILWSGSFYTAWGSDFEELVVSRDGITWHEAVKSGNYELVKVVDFDSSTFALDRRGGIYEVRNCTTWIDTLVLGNTRNNIYTDMIAVGSYLRVVGYGRQARSSDGYDWYAFTTCSSGFDRDGFEKAHWTGVYWYAVGAGEMVFRYNESGSGGGTCGAGAKPTLRDIASRDSVVVAVGDRGSILAGPDGSPLAQMRTGITADLNKVIWTGTRALACGNGGTVLGSDDGLVWVPESTGVTAAFEDIVYTGTFYAVAGNDGIIMSSADGHDWQACTTGTAADFQKIIPANGGAMALGLDGQTLVACWSANGRHWVASDVGNSIISIGGVNWNGERAVVGADAGDIFVSEDCSTWTGYRSGLHQYISGLEWHDGQYVLIHDYLMIGTSAAGTTWTERLRYGLDLWDLVWADSQWVAVGEDLTVVTSPDGIDWTKGRAGTGTDDMREVLWTGEKLLARGASALYSSVDGRDWTVHPYGSFQTLNSIAWTGTHYLAVGDNGIIMAAGDDPVSGIFDGAVSGPDAVPHTLIRKRLIIRDGESGIYIEGPGGVYDVMGKPVNGEIR